MEPKLNDPNSPTEDPAALRWSCEVLGFDSFEHGINKKKTRHAAMASFFNELRSNDFSVDNNSAAAVELIHGKDPQQSPAYIRGQQRKQLRQLDALIRWFASQLGVEDQQRLRNSLWRQLSQFNTEGCSQQVKNYGAKIWAAAESVKSPAGETNMAAKKVLQALFHIATIRSTQRNAVRRQYVVRLKKEFSEEQLTEARNTIWHHHDTPNEIFHRPFLWLLTNDEDAIDSYEIHQPVAATAATLPYQDSYSNPTTSNTSQKGGSNAALFVLIVVCSLVGLFVKVATRTSNRNNSNKSTQPWTMSSPKQPGFKFDPSLDPEDPRSVESALKALRTLEGEETELPTVEQFKDVKERAELAKRRMKERAAQGSEAKEPDSHKFINDIVKQRQEQRRQREQEQKRVFEQQQKMDAANKAMSDFIAKQNTKGQTPQQVPTVRPNDPNKTVEDILKRSRERQKKFQDDMKKRNAEFKRQMEEMRQRTNPSNRLPRTPTFNPQLP